MRLIEIPPVRRLFVPKDGYVLFECDLKRADPQVVAKEAGEETLLQAFRDGADVYTSMGKWLYEKDKLSNEERQWNKNAINGCLTVDHDVLTEHGWVNITEKPTKIMCWKEGVLSFERTQGWYDTISTIELLEWNERSFSQHVTYDHKMVYTQSGRKNWSYTIASSVPKSASLPKSGSFYSGSCEITPTEARLWCAIHADAAKTQDRWVFGFKKQRKVDRLRLILKQLNIEYDYIVYKNGVHNIRFDKKYSNIEPWLDSYLLNWPHDALRAYVDEAPFWDGIRVDVDGKTTHARYFLTTKKDQAEWFATMVHLTNRASLITEISPHKDSYRKELFYRVSIGERPLFKNVPPKKV